MIFQQKKAFQRVRFLNEEYAPNTDVRQNQNEKIWFAD